MKLWRWEKGRQEGGYDKLLLAKSERFKFDLYILRFPSGSKIGFHNDPSPEGYEHHRINFTLKRPDSGGAFIYKDLKTNKYHATWNRYVRFRPDIQRHMMSQVTGSMWFISLGWLRKSSNV